MIKISLCLSCFVFLLVPTFSWAEPDYYVEVLNIEDMKASHSVLLYGLALVLNAVALLAAIINRVKDTRRSHVDEFWMRKVVIPRIMEDFDIFCGKVNSLWPEHEPCLEASSVGAYIDSMQFSASGFIRSVSRYRKIGGNEVIASMVDGLEEAVDRLDGALVEVCSTMLQAEPDNIPPQTHRKFLSEANGIILQFEAFVLGEISDYHRRVIE